MPRKPDTPCSQCGKLLWSATTSLPPGDRTCRDCRRSDRPDCAHCGAVCPEGNERFCSRVCSGLVRRTSTDAKRLSRVASSANWRARIAAAGGLSHRQQRKLRDGWIKQGRRCAYCSAPCQSVDHVIPLSRGGTSFEGNLVPACTACNQAKGRRLLVEWRRVTGWSVAA